MSENANSTGPKPSQIRVWEKDEPACRSGGSRGCGSPGGWGGPNGRAASPGSDALSGTCTPDSGTASPAQ